MTTETETLRLRTVEESERLKEQYRTMEPVSGLERDHMMLLKKQWELFDELVEELDDYEHTFQLKWEAQQRAIARWQLAHPEKSHIMPDHSKLIEWLLEQLPEAG